MPEAVRDELHVGRLQGEDTPELEAYAWITIRTVRVPEIIQLITDLGPGEAQVLALALEEPGSLVILDDGFARAVATARGIRLTGTAGVLLKAKQEELQSTNEQLEEKAQLLSEQMTQIGYKNREVEQARAALQHLG